MRLIEIWKKYLDQNKFLSAVFMDLINASTASPHDLLIVEIHASDFLMKAGVLSFKKNVTNALK